MASSRYNSETIKHKSLTTKGLILELENSKQRKKRLNRSDNWMEAENMMKLLPVLLTSSSFFFLVILFKYQSIFSETFKSSCLSIEVFIGILKCAAFN